MTDSSDQQIISRLLHEHTPVAVNVGGRSFLTKPQTLLQRAPGFVAKRTSSTSDTPSSPESSKLGLLGQLLIEAYRTKHVHVHDEQANVSSSSSTSSSSVTTTTALVVADSPRSPAASSATSETKEASPFLEIFVDRDSTNFRYVLNYLRDGAQNVVLPYDWHKLHELLLEAQHFQLPGLTDLLQHHIDTFPDCCRNVGSSCAPHMSRVGTLRSQFVTASHLSAVGACDLLAFCENAGAGCMPALTRAVSDGKQPSSSQQHRKSITDIEDLGLSASPLVRALSAHTKLHSELSQDLNAPLPVSHHQQHHHHAEGVASPSPPALAALTVSDELAGSHLVVSEPELKKPVPLTGLPAAASPSKVAAGAATVAATAQVVAPAPVVPVKPFGSGDAFTDAVFTDAARSLFFPQELSAKPAENFFTWDEIRQHNTQASCWLVVNKKVYDVTRFLTKHPAGVDSIVRHGGTDATVDFQFHSRIAHNIWKNYEIGRVKCDTKCSVM